MTPGGAFPESFQTARLRAERLQPEHFDAIHAMQQDPVQMAMLGGVREEAETGAYMARNLRHWTDHGFGVWLLRDRESNAVAGRAVLRYLTIDATAEVEVGYGLVPALWGRGLATEIASACLAYGRAELGLGSMVALTAPDHARSRRVLEKIGMRYQRDFSHDGVLHALYRTIDDNGARS